MFCPCFFFIASATKVSDYGEKKMQIAKNAEKAIATYIF